MHPRTSRLYTFCVRPILDEMEERTGVRAGAVSVEQVTALNREFSSCRPQADILQLGRNAGVFDSKPCPMLH